MKQWYVTQNFNCEIDEEFYVLLQRKLDHDNIDELRSSWMMLNSTNMNHLGNEPLNTPMHSVQL